MNLSCKKIAFIINTMEKGGAERVLANLTLGFPNQWEIDIILSDAREILYPYRGNVIDLGIYRENYKTGFTYYLVALLKRCEVLQKLKKNRQYDAVIGFADSANVANILTKNQTCKVITAVHLALTEAGRLPQYKYVVSPLVRLLYNRSDKIVAVSKGIERNLCDDYKINKDKLITIYNGCDFNSIETKKQEELFSEEEEWFDGEFIITTMGRMKYAKGQWYLIRAFSEVVLQFPNAKLLILGDGEYREMLQDLVEKMGLKKNVVFCGNMDNPFKILFRSDLYVFPSLVEGFSNAIIEAMYCELPVIASDFNTGARELLAPDTDIAYKNKSEIEYAKYGVIVPVCDGKLKTEKDMLTVEEKLLAEAVIQMIRSEKQRKQYQKLSKERAEEFSLEKMVNNWISLIENN